MSAYTKDISALFSELSSGYNGLNDSAVLANRQKYGENRLVSKGHRSFAEKFIDQLKDFMVIILIVAAVISFAISLIEGHGEFIDAIVIISIVIINAVLGVQQESKAEQALDALKDMSAPTAKVLRNGIIEEIPSAEIVPGDIVEIAAGDFIPADGRIIEAASLKCEESALTGESVPVEKDYTAKIEENAPLGDRLNMVYSGCSATYGHAKILVTSTGMNTEMGKIAGLLDNEKSELTPLQNKLNNLGKYLGFIAIVICGVIFGVGLLQQMNPVEIFMTSVSLAVAAIPEGLTMVVTVVLAIGVQRMVKNGAIIRSLPAVETLGSASVICSDKTGTLTQNKMTVLKIWPAGGEIADAGEEISPECQKLLTYGSLCNDGRKNGGEDFIGDPTETSIVAAADKAGIFKSDIDEKYPRIAEIPFDSDRKLMTTVHEIDGKVISITKGGFDVILPLCIAGERDRAEDVNLEMAGSALRVLGIAYRFLDEKPASVTHEALEKDLTLLGFVGMIDPPRQESKDAVAVALKAGVKTVMITGDHVVTASAIAKDLGILNDGDRTISGQELAKLSDEELIENVEKYSVYARVSPEDKIRIVKAWQAKGHVAAMTGDGVNDAPALKAADIGCAMGITGTDVAKGAADMVLTDDNFATIVEAIKSGRGIYDNIKKTIQYLLGSNIGEIFTVFFSMIFGWGTPLLAIHLLLVNIVTDAFPALALGVEPVENNVMDRKPIPKNQSVFAGGLGTVIFLQGIMIGALSLSAFYVGQFIDISPLFPKSHGIGMTMAFYVLALSQISQAFNCRSSFSVFKVGFLSNPTMIKAAVGSVGVIFLIALVPPLSAVFKVSDLSMMHWIIVLGLSLAPLVIVECIKMLTKTRVKN